MYMSCGFCSTSWSLEVLARGKVRLFPPVKGFPSIQPWFRRVKIAQIPVLVRTPTLEERCNRPPSVIKVRKRSIDEKLASYCEELVR